MPTDRKHTDRIRRLLEWIDRQPAMPASVKLKVIGRIQHHLQTLIANAYLSQHEEASTKDKTK